MVVVAVRQDEMAPEDRIRFDISVKRLLVISKAVGRLESNCFQPLIWGQ